MGLALGKFSHGDLIFVSGRRELVAAKGDGLLVDAIGRETRENLDPPPSRMRLAANERTGIALLVDKIDAHGRLDGILDFLMGEIAGGEAVRELP